ncbi:hypothetical protein [Cupriavidus sp. PET2-C1]
MNNSIYGNCSIDSSAAKRKDVEKEFELAAMAARNKLKREQEHANLVFFKALRNTEPMDLQAISNAQANFTQTLAIASESYHRALESAERHRLCATSITEVPNDSRVSPATPDPFNDVVRGVAMQCATEFTSGSPRPIPTPLDR